MLFLIFVYTLAIHNASAVHNDISCPCIQYENSLELLPNMEITMVFGHECQATYINTFKINGERSKFAYAMYPSDVNGNLLITNEYYYEATDTGGHARCVNLEKVQIGLPDKQYVAVNIKCTNYLRNCYITYDIRGNCKNAVSGAQSLAPFWWLIVYLISFGFII